MAQTVTAQFRTARPVASFPRHPVPAGARPGRRPGGMRLTARGRRAAVTVSLLLAMAVGFAGGRADAATANPEGPVVEVVVGSGDTLWGLSEQVAVPGVDRRDLIAEIQRLNDLPSAEIRAGQVLRLPAPAGDESTS